jgi:ubiquinone/menaquinone biosynthesis C-methylase UbiE
MPDNLKFFQNNVGFYSDDYRDYSLKLWEQKIVDQVTGPEVLDVACGGGRMAVSILRKGLNVTGTDFVGEFEERVRRHQAEFKGTFKFVTAHMTKLPFPDSSFDSVICINSIVYLHGPEEISQTMKELCRILKPGGKLFVTSWNRWHPLWGSSIILNYILRRSHRFGETHPFFAMDSRIVKRSPTHMFVPGKNVLDRICELNGVSATTVTGRAFAGSSNPVLLIHPILVTSGTKL